MAVPPEMPHGCRKHERLVAWRRREVERGGGSAGAVALTGDQPPQYKSPCEPLVRRQTAPRGLCGRHHIGLMRTFRGIGTAVAALLAITGTFKVGAIN